MAQGRAEREGAGEGRHSWSLRLLGSLALAGPEGEVPLPHRAERVLAVVALRPGAARADVAATLWPRTDPARAQTNLRAGLAELRRVGDELITEGAGGGLVLRAGVRCDVDELARLALLPEVALVGAASRIEPLVCPLLPAWDESWLLLERRRLGDLVLDLVDRAAAALEETGDRPRAIRLLRAGVVLDPRRAPTHRLLSAMLQAEGERLEALRVHERHLRALEGAPAEDGPGLHVTLLAQRDRHSP